MPKFDARGIGDDFLASFQEDNFVPPELGLFERSATHVATSPFRAASGLSASIANLLGLPEEYRGGFLPEEDRALPAASTLSGQASNLLLGAVLPAGLEVAATAGAAAPGLARVANPLLRRMLSDAAGFGVLGAEQDRVTGLEQAGEGLGYGALTALPRMSRIPLAALLGMGSKAFFDRNGAVPLGEVGGHEWTQGDVAGLTGAITSLLPGKIPWRTPIPAPPPIPVVSSQFHGPIDPSSLNGPFPFYGPIAPPQPPGARQILGLPPLHPRTAQQAAQSFANVPVSGQPHGPFPMTPEESLIYGLSTGTEYSGTRNVVPGRDIFEMMGAPRNGWQNHPQSPFGPELQELQIRNSIREENAAIDLDAAKGWNPAVEAVPYHEGSIIPSPSVRSNPARLFDPAEAAWLKEKFNADINNPEVSNALLEARIKLARAEQFKDKRAAQLAFAELYEKLHHQPNVGGLTPEMGEQSWQDIVAMGVKKEVPPSPFSHPLAEGDPIIGMKKAKGRVAGLPESYRTEGGSIDPEVLGMLGLASARATIGGVAGGLLAPEEDRAMGVMVGALGLAGLPYARDLVGLMQKLGARNRGVALSKFREEATYYGGTLHSGDLNVEGNPLGLRPAVRDATGKLHVGKLGQGHVHIPKAFELAETDADIGFVTRQGKYLTSDEAGLLARQASSSTDPKFKSSVWPDRPPVSDESLQRLQTAFKDRQDLAAEYQSFIGKRGKINPVPEYRRTEGGSIPDDPTKLRPAVRMQDGSIVSDESATKHSDLISDDLRKILEDEGVEFGFIAKDGQFHPPSKGMSKGRNLESGGIANPFSGSGKDKNINVSARLKIFNNAADEVLMRTSYGLREEVASEKSYVIGWSNGHNRWDVTRGSGHRIDLPKIPDYNTDPVGWKEWHQKYDSIRDKWDLNKGNKVKLDANEILIKAPNRQIAEEIAKHLPEHPLNKFSHEQNPVAGSFGKLSPNNPIFKELQIDTDTFFKQPDKAAAFDKYMDYLQPLQSGMKKAGTEAGSIIPEVSAAIGRGVIGGVLGGSIGGLADDPDSNSGFVTGAIFGTIAAMSGPSFARSAMEAIGKAKLQTAPVGVKVPPKSWEYIKRNLEATIEERAGATLAGSTRIADRLVRWADSNFAITMPEEVKSVLLQAKGAGSYILDQVDNALTKVSLRYNPDKIVKGIADQYITGQISQADFLAQMQPHIQTNPQNGNYAQFITTAREGVTSLQRMVLAGTADPKMQKVIASSFDQYLTRSYKLFTDPKWEPNQNNIAKLAEHVAGLKIKSGPNVGKPLMDTDDIGAWITRLNQYVREVKQSKGLYVPSSSSAQAIDQALFQKRKALTSQWKEFLGEITDPTERLYQTIFRLRPMAEAGRYIDKIADVSVGGIKDGNIEVAGLPQVFSSINDIQAHSNKLLQQLQNVPVESPVHFEINKQLAALGYKEGQAFQTQYQWVDEVAKFGGLQRKWVSRNVWDTLKTYDSMTDVMDHPWLRSIANAHTAIKLGRTALSPVTIIRNIVTTPFFFAAGRSNLQDIKEAYKILRDANHPLRREIMERGIGNVDQVKTEFFKEYQNLTGSKYLFGEIDGANLGLGRLDLDLYEKVARRGFREILDFYRMPDNLVRISTYLSARRRIADKLGLALDNPDVLAKATEFTNRYTMNYDALPPAIKGLRQIPFVNLFLSYTAEMARIGKNLMVDVIQGGDGITSNHRFHAMALLGSLVALPEMLQSASEASLSDKDRADWERAKKLMPDYARTRYKIGIRRDKKTGQYHYIDFTTLISSDSFNQMGRAIENQDWKALAAVNPVLSWENTPALNIIMSQATGEDLHTGKKFRGAGDRFANIAKETLPNWIPGVGSEWKRGQMALAYNEEGTQGLTNAKTGVKITPSEFWGTYFGPLAGEAMVPGTKKGSVNLSVLQKKAVSAAKQDVADIIAYANDVLRMDYPREKKQQVIEQTKVALEAVQARYAEQLGVTP